MQSMERISHLYLSKQEESIAMIGLISPIHNMQTWICMHVRASCFCSASTLSSPVLRKKIHQEIILNISDTDFKSKAGTYLSGWRLRVMSLCARNGSGDPGQLSQSACLTNTEPPFYQMPLNTAQCSEWAVFCFLFVCFAFT